MSDPTSTLALPPLPPASGRPHPRRDAWLWRVQSWLSHYLPLAFLALGALFTTWLLRQTPPVSGPTIERPQRTAPDYTMSNFELLRYLPSGRQQAWLRGQTLRHYPHNDQIQVEHLVLRWVDDSGQLLVAEAQRGSGHAQGDRLMLEGAVRVRRYASEAAGDQQTAPEWELRTEALEAWGPEQRLFSAQASRLETPRLQLQARGFAYQHRKGQLQFHGPSHTELKPPRAR